jgi:hypothetical protein
VQISIEKLVEIIVREVVKELLAKGIVIDNTSFSHNKIEYLEEKKSIEIDMSGFRTPVLTENQLTSLESSIEEIIVPGGTILTPVAREIIQKRKLKINYKSK